MRWWHPGQATPPSEGLYRWLNGDGEGGIAGLAHHPDQARLEVARSEMGAQEHFDHVVVNADLEQCTAEVARHIARARSGL